MHRILKDALVSKYGARTWGKVLAELRTLGVGDGEHDSALLELRQYDDQTTITCLEIAARVLDVSFDDTLMMFGGHMVAYFAVGGYMRMLRAFAGTTPREFLKNINHLHSNLERSFRDSAFPSFEVDDLPPDAPRMTRRVSRKVRRFPSKLDEDFDDFDDVGDFDDDDDGDDVVTGGEVFVLSYSSPRGAILAPLVVGMLMTLSQIMFDRELEFVRLPAAKVKTSASWHVRTHPRSQEAADAGKAAIDLVKAGHEEVKQAGGYWHSAMCTVGRAAARLTKGFKKPAARDEAYQLVISKQQPSPLTSARTSTVALEELVGKSAYLSEVDKSALDKLQKLVQKAARPADLLMKAIPAGSVAAHWDDAEGLDRCARFWSTNVGDAADYSKSSFVARARRFVSHSWSAPADWVEVMGPECSYTDVKATELAAVAQDITERLDDVGSSECPRDWRTDTTFWIDKACIPQEHALLTFCVEQLEEYMERCDGLVCLVSWEYFDRLWCVYEWAAFLVYHDLSSITVCVDAFLRPGTVGRYVASVERISVAGCKCFCEKDRDVLRAKVALNYVSERAFEVYAQATAIACIAKALVAKASRGTQSGGYAEELVPWIDLASRLGLESLAEALRKAHPRTWRRAAMADDPTSVEQAVEKGVVLDVDIPNEDFGRTNREIVYKRGRSTFDFLEGAPTMDAEEPQEEEEHLDWSPATELHARCFMDSDDDDHAVHKSPPSEEEEEEECASPTNPRPWRLRFSAAVDRWYEAEIVPVLGELKEVSLLNKNSSFRRRHRLSLKPYSPIRPPRTISGTYLSSLAAHAPE